jgi:hypothetical protein
MCDAWLARVLAGDQSLEVLAGAWASIRTFGWEIRRLGVTELQFRPEVSDGLFLRLAVTSGESLACAYAAALAEAKHYEEAAKLLDGVEPRHPFDEELVTYVRGVLYFRTGRWPDVLLQFPEGKVWRNPELKAAGAAMATTALASLGVFEEAVRRGQAAIEADRVPGAANVALYTQGMCLRHLGGEEEAAERRPDRTADVDGDAVQRDRPRQLLARDEVRRRRLPGRAHERDAGADLESQLEASR